MLRPQVLEGPLFSLRYSAVFALVGVFVAAPLALLYAVLSLLAFIQLGTQGFVSFDAVGVSLSDRHYQRGASEVRLVGMMHIGEAEAYDEIVRSFARESTIVLEEGVTLRPKVHVYADRAPDWCAIEDDLPRAGGETGVEPLT